MELLLAPVDGSFCPPDLRNFKLGNWNRLLTLFNPDLNILFISCWWVDLWPPIALFIHIFPNSESPKWMCWFLPVFVASSFLPEPGCWCHSMIHNSILAKCHPNTGSLHTYLREVLEVAGRSRGGPISRISRDIEPKTLD